MKLLTFFAAAMLLPATIAHASESDEGATIGIRVHGDVAQTCQISSPKSIDLGDLERAHLQADLKFEFKCNTPFVLQIQASNGALTNVGSPHGDGPYAGALPYSIALALPVRHPASALIARNFASHDLLGGQQVSSQGGIASDGFSLTMLTGQPSGSAGLLAGDYTETLTLTVSVI